MVVAETGLMRADGIRKPQGQTENPIRPRCCRNEEAVLARLGDHPHRNQTLLFRDPDDLFADAGRAEGKHRQTQQHFASGRRRFNLRWLLARRRTT